MTLFLSILGVLILTAGLVYIATRGESIPSNSRGGGAPPDDDERRIDP